MLIAQVPIFVAWQQCGDAYLAKWHWNISAISGGSHCNENPKGRELKQEKRYRICSPNHRKREYHSVIELSFCIPHISHKLKSKYSVLCS